jgi:isoleucyl-tRNA synthetase
MMLHRYAMQRMIDLHTGVQAALKLHNTGRTLALVNNCVANDLSALYYDCIKDSLCVACAAQSRTPMTCVGHLLLQLLRLAHEPAQAGCADHALAGIAHVGSKFRANAAAPCRGCFSSRARFVHPRIHVHAQ